MVEKLEVALWSCGGSLEDVDEAFALSSPQILQSFELHRALVTTKHITAPSLFKKDNWKSMDNPTLRSEIIAEHEKHLGKFEWNASEQLKVSLMVQGTTTEAGWSIAQGGYGVIASVNDQGWFGKGIYVRSSMRYAHQYTSPFLCSPPPNSFGFQTSCYFILHIKYIIWQVWC